MRITIAITLLTFAVACSAQQPAPAPDSEPPAEVSAVASEHAVAEPAEVAEPTEAPTANASAPGSAPAEPLPPDDEPDIVDPALTPALARGTCSGRAELKTTKGTVSCYPYRCRAGRCLLSCKTRKDCAGSDGPADLAEHGWPLDCRSNNECVPLPPRHVNP